MFLPTTYLKLHGPVGSNCRKVPLECYIKPDQIQSMTVMNAKSGKEGDPDAKDVELTKIVALMNPEPHYVQEPPEMIMKMIADAFNQDVQVLQNAQNGLVLAGGGGLQPASRLVK